MSKTFSLNLDRQTKILRGNPDQIIHATLNVLTDLYAMPQWMNSKLYDATAFKNFLLMYSI